MQITRATSQIVPIKPVELMKGRYDQHIGVYEDHVPKFLCDKLSRVYCDKVFISSNISLIIYITAMSQNMPRIISQATSPVSGPSICNKQIVKIVFYPQQTTIKISGQE